MDSKDMMKLAMYNELLDVEMESLKELGRGVDHLAPLEIYYNMIVVRILALINRIEKQPFRHLLSEKLESVKQTVTDISKKANIGTTPKK